MAVARSSPPTNALPWRIVHATLLVGYTVFVLGATIWASITPDTTWWLALASEFSFFVLAASPIALALALVRPTPISIGLGTVPLVLFALIYGGRLVPHPPASAGSDRREITVYTQNIAGMYTLLEGLQSQIERVQPDLLAMQEVPSHVDQLHQAADPMLPYSVLEPRPNPSGIGTWSRLPILDTQTLTLVPGGHLSQRTRIDMGGETLTLYSVHLNPPWPRGWHGTLTPFAFVNPVESSLRQAQVQALLQDVRAQPGPVIVAGDFNMGERTWDYRQLSAVLTDAFASSGRGLGHTFPSRDEWWPFGLHLPPALRIDYVWLGPGLTAREVQVADQMGSDHQGLIARIAVD
ncbi:MAG: Endonuclease/Exonuclease/phosphatase family protein [Chloroflexi bacterium]|nr:Endonuclease/Exonuclease/phosphatase family protein [Chloroflexota bacterium]